MPWKLILTFLERGERMNFLEDIFVIVAIIFLITFFDDLDYKWKQGKEMKQDERKHYRTYLGRHFDDFS